MVKIVQDFHVYNFEIQKRGQILCAHKTYFLMLGHIIILGEMHGIGGEPGALIDACIHLATYH